MSLNRVYWSAYLARQLLGQASYPFRSLASIERDRDRRVRAMVRHAYTTVPFYREAMDQLGLRPADFQTALDLARLPLVNRHDLQEAPERFVSTAQPLRRYLRIRSGGSTGAPVDVYHDSRGLLQNAAHGERERSMLARLVGKAVGYREAVIASSMSTAREVQSFSHRLGLFPAGVRIERRYLSLLDPPEKNLELLNAFRPDVVHSYGSYLEALFPYLHRTGAPFHRPKVVTYSSDGLSDAVQKLIQDQFGIPVLGTYQAAEAFKIAFECLEHSGFHLNVDLYPLRIVEVNGQTVPPDTSGEVVVSNLVNGATVLLNYRLGDVATLVRAGCPCGRSLPLLSRLQGRSDDWIRLPSGREVHPQLVRTILSSQDHIWRYQIVQESLWEFQVLIVAAEDCNRQATCDQITARFAEGLGDGVRVEVLFVDSLPRTAAGKTRAVVAMGQETGA